MRKRLAVLSIIAISCGPGAMTSEELLNYSLNPESGLLQRIEKSNTVLEMYYKPKELVVKQELQGVTDLEMQNSIRKRFDTLDYFVLRLKRQGREIETSYASNPIQFTEVVTYLSYYVASDITLIHERDTLSPLDISYVRSYGASDATSLMAVFNSNLKDKDGVVRVVFDDKRLGTGLNEFDFDISDIKNIPHLK